MIIMRIHKKKQNMIFSLSLMVFMTVLVLAVILSSDTMQAAGGQFGLIDKSKYTADAYGCYQEGNPENPFVGGNSVCGNEFTEMLCVVKWSWWPFHNFAGYEWQARTCKDGGRCFPSPGNPTRATVCIPAKEIIPRESLNIP